MKWSMDTHKYMSEITRSALKILADNNITADSEPEDIENAERKLAEAGVYKDFESARGRIRRALFTYFRAYGCMDDNGRLTETGRAFADEKFTIQEISLWYVANYIYENDDNKYRPLELLLKFLDLAASISTAEAFITPYDFARLVECNSFDEVTLSFVKEQIDARTGEIPLVNERAVGYDVWVKMLTQAGLFKRNEDRSISISNKNLADWMLEAYRKPCNYVHGKICTGIFENLPAPNLGDLKQNCSLYSDEGLALAAYLFDKVEEKIINKYIARLSDIVTINESFGINKTHYGYYMDFCGLERLIGHTLVESNNPSLRAVGAALIETEIDITDAQEEDNYDDVLKHNLYGIHIKELNDALSEDHPHICIGWSCLGNLNHIDSRDQLGELYDMHITKEARGRGQDLGQIWRFLKETNAGDYVVFADDSLCHIGRIESDYIFDDSENPNENPDYANKRIVTWLKKDIPRSSLSTAFHRSLMTAMSYWGLNDYKSSVVELLKGTYLKDVVDDLGEVKETEGVKMITFESKIDCDLPRNRILFGAPGTGKSHTLDKETDALIKSMDGEYERVTFHPDYSYANFVGTYKPVPSAEGITYKYVPGPFMRVLKKALENANNPDATPRPFVLVIEEINRANVAAVFGDVFQLLDRNKKNISDYGIQASEDLKNHLAEKLGGHPDSYAELRIPSNMFIWATMNSADQGVFPMDTAFKRRWDFTYLGIDNGDENIAEKKVTIGKGDYKRVVEWNKLRKAINAVLSSKDFKINEDKLMGPYFLSTKVIPLEGEIDANKFTDAFKSKVIMYLFEDAAKQKKHTLFSGCSDTTRYSSIRDEFDTKGVFIFCDEIHNQFPAPANGEGETQ